MMKAPGCRALILLVSGSIAWAAADAPPRPPCAGEVSPPYPDLDRSPAVKVWQHADWMPPACMAWPPSPDATLTVTVARFRYTAGAAGLRRRIGAISGLAGVSYWSTTNQRWQPLILSAWALTGPDSGQRRPDYSPDEVAASRILYAQQEDSLLGKGIYRIQVRSANNERLVFATENAAAIRFLGIPVFQPGEVQAVYFLDREGGDVWRYYSIARAGRQASLLGAGHEASLINRAVAFYRHLAGIPTDKEPPAAR